MTGRSGDAHDPTVLAVSRYGTLWLLDARTGSVRWRLVNGCRLGELAHGGEMLYLTAYSSGWVRRDTRTPPLSRDELRQYQQLWVTPAEIVAVRTQDGSTAWRRQGWVRLNRPLGVLFGGGPLDGDHLVTDVTDFGETTPVISALDRTTGAVRWRSPCADEPGAGQLQGARAGSVYVYQADQRRLDVFDTTTGDLRWSCGQPGIWSWRLSRLSQGGTLLAELGHAQGDADWPLTVRRTSDGAIAATLSVQGRFLALTDTGIVYLAVGPEWKLRVEALRISDGTRLWRAERRGPLPAPRQIVPFLSCATERSLYFARLKQPSYLAEARAFDVRSGQQRWHWHSPAHLVPLLTLWGWRTPQVIGFALSQGCRSIMRAHEHQQHRGSMAGEMARQVVHGQWRHPTRLLGDVFSAAVGQGEPPDDERLYLGTSMGLFALGARGGHRLWHALPMMEIASIVPAPGVTIQPESACNAVSGVSM